MSTRAVYTFQETNCENDETYHVYKHSDGYPSGAAEWIEKALKYAWPLPRFEAGDFAAAFVCANKPKNMGRLRGGDVYLTHGYDRHPDLEYRYEISFEHDDLNVMAFVRIQSGKFKGMYHEIFYGPVDDFKNKAKELDDYVWLD